MTIQHPLYFHCTRRDMLVAKDLSDCIGCPLRTLTISGEPALCGQYEEYARIKLRTKLGLPPMATQDIDVSQVKPEELM